MLPLRLVFWLGLGSSILATCGLLFFLAFRIFGFEIFGHSPADVPGFTSVILSIFLIGGVQLLSIGVLGEYLGRVYLEVKELSRLCRLAGTSAFDTLRALASERRLSLQD